MKDEEKDPQVSFSDRMAAAVAEIAIHFLLNVVKFHHRQRFTRRYQ